MNDIALYIHIPFCNSKCFYCDFYSVCEKQEKENYIYALENEFKKWASVLKTKKVKTIYIGGGTPSVMPPSFFVKLEKLIKKFCTLELDEFTCEVNPNSFNENLAKTLKQIGVTRLSVGLQSANDLLLKKIGRNQTFTQFSNAMQIAKKYFDNISIDLMVGLPGQTNKDVKKTIKKVLKFKPQHISCYYLMVEEKTPLAKMNNLISQIPSETEQIKMFNVITSTLRRRGFERYEVSNFAKKSRIKDKYISKHNSSYWKNVEYIGLGPGASSFVLGERFSNEKDVKKYIAGSYLVSKDKITPKKARMEKVMLGIRTKWGVNVADCNPKSINLMKKKGFIRQLDDRIFITKKGFNVLNLIIDELT